MTMTEQKQSFRVKLNGYDTEIQSIAYLSQTELSVMKSADRRSAHNQFIIDRIAVRMWLSFGIYVKSAKNR